MATIKRRIQPTANQSFFMGKIFQMHKDNDEIEKQKYGTAIEKQVQFQLSFTLNTG